MELSPPPGPISGSLRRVDRWLRVEGRGLAPISMPAALLLDQRLRLRTRALAIAAPIAVFAVGSMIMSGLTANLNKPGAGNATAVRYWVATMALFAVAALVITAVVSHGERGLAAGLTHRVVADHLRSPWERLGRARVLAACLVVIANISILLAMVVMHASPRLIVTFAVTFVAVSGSVATTVRRLLSAESVAVDRDSLTIDERIRSRALYLSVLPLVVLASGVGLLIHLLGAFYGEIGWIAILAPFVCPVFFGLEALALSRTGRAQLSSNRIPGRTGWSG